MAVMMEPQPSLRELPEGRIYVGGPLLLTLLMGNNNNNAQAQAQNQTHAQVIPDTLQMKSQSVVVELQSGTLRSGLESTASSLESGSSFQPPNIREDGDGPLLLTLLLTNQNQNAAAAQPGTQTQPMPDTLQMKPWSVLPELQVAGTSPTDDIDTTYRVANDTSTKKVHSNHCLEQHSVGLTEEQLQFWKRNGFLVIEDALNQQAVPALMTNVEQLAEKFVAQRSDECIVHHIKEDAVEVTPNGRLLSSSLPESFGPTLSPMQRIQRIGLGVHRLVPRFRSAIMSAFNEQIARSLGFHDPRVTQSLIVTKAAHSGIEVIPHQDGCSNFVKATETDAPGAVTFWYALQNATARNGCLMVVPGSHRTEPLRRRCQVDDHGLPQFVPVDPPIFSPFSKSKEAIEPKRKEDGTYEYEKLEVKAGTLILMHGHLLHASEANVSDEGRVAFNFGVVEGTLPWLADNYLQPYEGTMEFEKLEPKT